MIAQNELSAEAIRQTVQEVAQTHLPLQAAGYITTAEMLYDVLMKAATERISLEAACRDLDRSATGNTVRELLNQQLDATHLRQYEAAINHALQARWPNQLRQPTVEAAIDEHDEPFYGKTPDLKAYTRRSKTKQGTSHFFRIASAYLMYRHLRVTVAVTFVLPEDDTLAVVQRLHQALLAAHVRPRVLYLDRGFCCGPVIGYLQAQQQPTILACAIRGKQGGTRQLCHGRASYRTPYTFTDGTTVEMVVVATLVPGKDKRRRRKWLLFVVIGLTWAPPTIYRRYRRRFGIESSYRILRRVRIKTTSRNAAFRFFVLGFALLLVNLWALLRWQVARLAGPGPQRVCPRYFQFQSFVSFLRRAIEQLYGVPMVVPFATPGPKS